MLKRWARTTKSARRIVCLALLGGLAVVGSGAYAVYAATERGERKPELPTPSITTKPVKHSKKRWASFSFTNHRRGVTFRCSLDGSRYKACASPKRYPGPLTEGRHTFQVRARSRTRKRVLSSPASYTWSVDWLPPTPDITRHPAGPTGSMQASDESFSISPDVIGSLYPGAVPLSIPLTLSNPNGVPIYVTSLTIAVTNSPAGCSSATNISLSQSSVSSTAPVLIQANGSVTLPAQGVAAPTIQLVDLPVNQDACRNATFSLSFTGSAHL
jgi:hypothetical protein